jgi:hypothetical protein
MNMTKSAIMKQIAQQAGWEVVEVRLPESLPMTDVRGLPRVDIKTLVEQSRRRMVLDALILPSDE